MKLKRYATLALPDNTPRLGAICIWCVAMTPSLPLYVMGVAFRASMCHPVWEILNFS